MKRKTVSQRYREAKAIYAEAGVDSDKALKALAKVPISLHCWQGDDVSGFENPGAGLDGGLMITGNHPGKARNIDELRADFEMALSLMPGKHRVNLHAIYGDYSAGRVDRDAIGPKQFESWVQWAKRQKVGVDFNATCFSHPLAKSGYTLSSTDEGVRKFWVEHFKRCREISAYLGKALGSTCIHNLWIPDGTKEVTVNRFLHRGLLKKSLDEALKKNLSPKYMKDAFEGKLFGIGTESFTVGSHDFYLPYAIKNKKMICLDTGHFHPTESVAEKLSGILQSADECLVQVSRGIRWDSDHVVVYSDDLRALAEEMVRSGKMDKIYLGLDYFDASLNRIGAWVIGVHATQKALLAALLQPLARMRKHELEGDNFLRLAWHEEAKTLPLGAVWDYFCESHGVRPGTGWMEQISQYEAQVTIHRN